MSYAPQTCQCTLLNCGCVRCTYESLSRPKAKKTPQLWTWCVQYLSEHLKTPSYHLRKKYRLVEFFSVKRGDIDFILHTKGRHTSFAASHTRSSQWEKETPNSRETLLTSWLQTPTVSMKSRSHLSLFMCEYNGCTRCFLHVLYLYCVPVESVETWNAIIRGQRSHDMW